jgi:hypothetical protein
MAIEDWKDRSIPTTFQQNAAVADPTFVKTFQHYDVSNPHPGYGKDPNILNEFGHTKYPMMVYPNGRGLPGKIVNNEHEENEALGKEAPELRQDGPTLEEYMAHGYKASTYPPKGFAAKSPQEEIDKAVEQEKSPQSW